MNRTAGLPLVTILTLNYNGKRFLKNLFDSLRSCTYPNLEIIMADNASTDDSVNFVQSEYPEVKILRNAENYMFARGNNEGLKIANGKYICVINNDVEVAPDFVEPVVAAFEANPHLAAAQPKILAMQQRDHLEYSGACGGFIDWFGYPFVRGRLFQDIEKDDGQYDQPCGLFWASGACIFLRKTAIDAVGVFDEDFMMHMEEIDLCWRLRLNGWDIGAFPASKIWHHVGGTLNKDNPRKMYWNYRNNLFLLMKNLSRKNLLIRIPMRMPLDFLALAVETAKGRLGNSAAILRAYKWVFSHLGLILRKRREVQRARTVSDETIFERVYSGSIVFEYFVLGKRKFSDLRAAEPLLAKNLKPFEIKYSRNITGATLSNER